MHYLCVSGLLKATQDNSEGCDSGKDTIPFVTTDLEGSIYYVKYGLHLCIIFIFRSSTTAAGLCHLTGKDLKVLVTIQLL